MHRFFGNTAFGNLTPITVEAIDNLGYTERKEINVFIINF